MAIQIPMLVLIILTAGVFPILAFVAAIIYLCNYIHEDDKPCNTAFLPKLVFLIAFMLGVLSIIIMPLDVANAKFLRDDGLQFAIGIIWQVFYGIVILFCVFIIPFSVCYYEAQDNDYPGVKGVVRQSMWGSVGCISVLVVLCVILGVTYWWAGYAVIPYVYYTNDKFVTTLAQAKTISAARDRGFYKWDNFQIFISPVVFLIAVLSFFGWLGLVLFGGCGMTTLPISCIKAFCTRPRMIKSDEFKQKRDEVQRQAEKLIELGEKLALQQENDKFGAKTRKAFGLFKQASNQLEADWALIHKRYYKGGGSLFFAIFQLFYGVIAAIFSLIWVVHIILYLCFPPWVFQFGLLNIVFYYCDIITAEFPIIGAILFTIFSFHLILAVLSGIEVLGRRFSFINAYNLKESGTLMNSMLVNVGIFLLCCVTATQFASRAFAGYVRQTMLEMMFGGVITNLQYIGYFYQYVHYALLGMIFLGIPLGIIDAICSPKKAEEKQLDEAMRALSAL